MTRRGCVLSGCYRYCRLSRTQRCPLGHEVPEADPVVVLASKLWAWLRGNLDRRRYRG